MKKLLSIIMCITLIFAFTACGSEDEGTKGKLEGHLYRVEWSKAMFGNSMKVTVTGNLAADDTWEETVISASYDLDAKPDLTPFAFEKKISSKKAVYTISPVAGVLDELEAAEIRVDYEITDSKAETEGENHDLNLKISLTSSEGVPLRFDITGFYEGRVYDELDVPGEYGIGVNTDGSIDGSLEIALDNKWGSDWEVDKYDEKYITCTSEGVNEDGQVIFAIEGHKEGETKLTIKNITKGFEYLFDLKIVNVKPESQTITGEDGTSSETFVPDVFKVTVSNVERIDTPTKIEGMYNYEELKQDEELAVDIEEIVVPEGAHVERIYTVDETNDSEGEKGIITTLVYQDNDWRYIVNAGMTKQDMEAYYGFAKMKSIGVEVVVQEVEIKGIKVSCYAMENSVICIWEKGGSVHVMEGIELHRGINQSDVGDMLNSMV